MIIVLSLCVIVFYFGLLQKKFDEMKYEGENDYVEMCCILGMQIILILYYFFLYDF